MVTQVLMYSVYTGYECDILTVNSCTLVLGSYKIKDKYLFLCIGVQLALSYYVLIAKAIFKLENLKAVFILL